MTKYPGTTWFQLPFSMPLNNIDHAGYPFVTNSMYSKKPSLTKPHSDLYPARGGR